MAKVSVKLDGSKTSVEVDGVNTVQEALMAAANVLGVGDTFVIHTVVPVVNSNDDVELEDEVNDGDEVTATTNVQNG